MSKHRIEYNIKISLPIKKAWKLEKYMEELEHRFTLNELIQNILWQWMDGELERAIGDMDIDYEKDFREKYGELKV